MNDMSAGPDTFQGQTAVVTGGAQGIGRAVVERLLANGAKVAIWDSDRSALDVAAAELGDAVLPVQVDISEYEAVEAALKTTLDENQSVEVLVHSAGIAGPNAATADYPIDAWREIVRINLDGTFYVNRAVLGTMRFRGYGRIVNIASIAGKEGNSNAPAYSATKAAVVGLTKSIGKEEAGRDIAVNCVTPAAARTRIFDQMSQEHIDYMLSKIPRGRFLEVDEAAAMICWLASRENSFTTGAVFDLSGGRATY